MLKIALIGRPNVGKSTLFNRMVRKKLAIIHDVPGVTRDYREAPLADEHIRAQILDTAGYEDPKAGTLASRMWQQSTAALDAADAAVLVVDVRDGLLPHDREVARLIRESGKPVLLLVNKCDSGRLPPNFNEFYRLNCGEPMPFSATHGDGMSELLGWISDLAKKYARNHPEESAQDEEAHALESKTLHLAIVGRPNAGKSTLLNALIGQQRQLTGPEPGLTRDAIHISWKWKGQPIRLVDTAGLRKQARIKDFLEKMSVGETLRAVRLAHVVMLVVDATMALEEQDMEIARHVAEEGRCLIVVVNKIDQIKQPRDKLNELQERLEESLAQLPGVPLVPISALRGKGLDKLMPAVMDVYEKWNKRISTGQLNRFLSEAQAHHNAPLVRGKRLKIRYMTQIKTRPPTFMLFTNFAREMPADYQRYLLNVMRDMFDLHGVPLRVQLKQGENPYKNKSAPRRFSEQKTKRAQAAHKKKYGRKKKQLR